MSVARAMTGSRENEEEHAVGTRYQSARLSVHLVLFKPQPQAVLRYFQVPDSQLRC